MRFQPIYDIAEVCSRKNITEAVLCPGSRCAPLTLAFARHSKINTRTFSDERSAGYIALGIAQATKKPVAIVCTSGTAVYNLAPAVAEAFFSETPLIVLTADRPVEWIGQHDGQTIHQDGIFGRHVKRSYQLPQDYDHEDSRWLINRTVNEAINLSVQHPRGPVHVNVPFREPLYPSPDEKIIYSSDVRIIETPPSIHQLDESTKADIHKRWRSAQRILIVAGQHYNDNALTTALNGVSTKHSIPVIADIIANQHGVANNIRHADLFLGQATHAVKEKLVPDLLITFGQSLISKNVKMFLRECRVAMHWHIQPAGAAADTFRQLSSVFHVAPADFLSWLGTLERAADQAEYLQEWRAHAVKTRHELDHFFEDHELSELEVVRDVMYSLPKEATLHLANSMSVRYANFLGYDHNHFTTCVYSNRGTSGVDGCTSTAVGHYLASGKPTVLITGDLAFFYDRNAFWHNYPLENFRVVVLNNHGGLIFNILEGPSRMPEAAEYFVTRQPLNARSLCREFGFEHLAPRTRMEFREALSRFFTFDGRTKILEIEGDGDFNRTIFDRLKRLIKKNYDA